MKIDDKVFKFIGEVCSNVVIAIIMATTHTVYHRYLEEKIINIIDNNQKKDKNPIGFRVES